MTKFKQNQKNHFYHSNLFFLFILIVILIFSYNLFVLVKKEKETTRKKAIVVNQLDLLEKREDLLNKDIDKLKTDIGIEESIRDKYQVALAGEKVVAIVDSQQTTSEAQEEVIDHSFWGFIKRMFKK